MSFRTQFLVWLGLVFLMFAVGTFVGENTNTMEHFIARPVIAVIIVGLLYFAAKMILPSLNKK